MALTDVTDGSRVIQQGMMPYKITFETSAGTETIRQGDLVGWDADSGQWEKADADAKVYADFVSGQCGASGDVITVYRQAIVTGFSAGVAGNPVYLGNTAGEYEDTPDSTGYQQVVGVCLSTTEVLVEPRAAVGVFGINRQSLGWAGFIRSEMQDETSNALWGGLRIDVKACTGATISGDAYGLFVFMQLQTAPTTQSALIRLEDGCSASCGVDSYISFVGGTGGDPPDQLFYFTTTSPTNDAWGITHNISGSTTGNIKLNFGGTLRYLALYSAIT